MDEVFGFYRKGFKCVDYIVYWYCWFVVVVYVLRLVIVCKGNFIDFYVVGGKVFVDGFGFVECRKFFLGLFVDVCCGWCNEMG